MIVDKALRYNDDKDNLLKSRTELAIAKLLQHLNIDYEYNYTISIDGREYNVDFKIDNKFIEVIDSNVDLGKFNELRNKLDIIGIGSAMHVGKQEELDQLFIFNEDSEHGSIFIEDPSLSFDYAHILPLVEKCSVLHGHTASVMVEIIGSMKNNMVIDFGDAKRLVKKAISELDHKFFVNRKYVVDEDNEYYKIICNGPNGRFDMSIPKHTAYMLNGEATVENLSSEIIRLLMPKMPSNVNALGIYVYEGVSKGAHLISRLYKR